MSSPTAEDILNGPDYFTCEQYAGRPRLSKVACVKRQQAIKAWSRRAGVDEVNEFEKCANCPQGREIKKELEEKTMFNKPFQKPKPQSERIFERDGVKYQICRGPCGRELKLSFENYYHDKTSPTGFQKICKACVRDRQRDSRKRRKEAKHKKKREQAQVKKQLDQNLTPGSELDEIEPVDILEVDLTNYPHIRSGLDEMALSEYRTPGLQAAHLLHAAIERWEAGEPARNLDNSP